MYHFWKIFCVFCTQKQRDLVFMRPAAGPEPASFSNTLLRRPLVGKLRRLLIGRQRELSTKRKVLRLETFTQLCDTFGGSVYLAPIEIYIWSNLGAM